MHSINEKSSESMWPTKSLYFESFSVRIQGEHVVCEQEEDDTNKDERNRFSSASDIPQSTTVPYSKMKISASVGVSNMSFDLCFGRDPSSGRASSETPRRSPVGVFPFCMWKESANWLGGSYTYGV